MSAPPDVSIVISNFNSRDLLRRCLVSVRADVQAHSLVAEVLVVDDGSQDGSPEMVASEFPEVRLIAFDANQGYARANNAGVRASTGQSVLLLNADTVIHGGALSALLDGLARYPRAAAVGPTLLNADGSIQRSCWRFPLVSLIGNTLFLFRLGIWDDYRRWDYRADRDVDWISSAALMLRRSVVERIGLLDDQFGLYGIDTDWALRARRAGYGFVSLARPRIIHHGRASWQDDRALMYRDHLQGHELFFRKHHGMFGLLLYRILLLANSIPRMAFWGVLYFVGNRRVRHKVGHFSRLVRWGLLGGT